MNETPTSAGLHASGLRCQRTGSFALPCVPGVALPLFTPEGERSWVPGWTPTYLSGASDEAGAVWTTEAHGVSVTWVTVIRDAGRVRYARVSANGTAGYVDVRCSRDSDGTCVTVEYDLTATRQIGRAALEELDRGFDMMLEEWRELTSQLLSRPA